MKYRERLSRPDIIGFIAASGVGKTAEIVRMVAKDTRLLVFDFKGEYPRRAGCKPVSSMAEVLAEIRKPSFRVAYQPPGAVRPRKDAFAEICEAIWRRGRMTYLVSELSRVTSPSFACDEWGNITCAGKERGLHIRADSQFPAQMDKEFLLNCSEVLVGRLTGKSACKAMEPILQNNISKLPTMRDHHYLLWQSSEPDAVKPWHKPQRKA